MEILPSALKHGITDSEIRAALQVPMRYVRLADDLLLVIGTDTSGRIVELVVADPDTDRERVIHAMPIRPKFYRYL